VIRRYALTVQMVLCHLRCHPEQRLVHQHACCPDGDGHCVAPEGWYFRRMRIGSSARMNRTVFRQVLKTGWLEPLAMPPGGDQIEYRLRAEAIDRFEHDPEWRASEDAFRAAFKLPPRLVIVGAA
jgi:hypothetical protein